MNAKFINEKFKEDSDPIKDMGIGLQYIFNKDKQLHGQISSVESSEILFGDKHHDIESYLIYRIISNCISDNDFSVNSMKQFLNTCITNEVHQSMTRFYYRAPLNDYEKIKKNIIRAFKRIYNIDLGVKSINEKFKEDSDPIKDMDIGNPFTPQNFENCDEWVEFLYDNFEIITGEKLIFSNIFNTGQGTIRSECYMKICDKAMQWKWCINGIQIPEDDCFWPEFLRIYCFNK